MMGGFKWLEILLNSSCTAHTTQNEKSVNSDSGKPGAKAGFGPNPPPFHIPCTGSFPLRLEHAGNGEGQNEETENKEGPVPLHKKLLAPIQEERTTAEQTEPLSFSIHVSIPSFPIPNVQTTREHPQEVLIQFLPKRKRKTTHDEE